MLVASINIARELTHCFNKNLKVGSGFFYDSFTEQDLSAFA